MQKAIKIMCVTNTIQQKRKNNKVGIDVFMCIFKKKQSKAAKSSAEFREGQGFVVMSVINWV